MNKSFPMILALLFFSALVAKEPSSILGLHLLTEDQTYRHASELVAAINRKDWESMPGRKGGFIERLKINAKSEKWRGIGAYRKTTKKSDDSPSVDLQHHFGYESNLGPHELWVIYRKMDDGYIYDQILVFGW